MSLPDPDAIHPLPHLERVVFLKPLLAALGEDAPANVEVGAFSYDDDPDHARDFFARNRLCNVAGDTRLRAGHGAVIGARSVVTRDVPDDAVVAGNPARIVRRRYAQDDAARLVALAWWDWPVARIAQAIPLLVKGSVAELEAFAAA
jgi:virginiamycin A acetyltransferase